ncbi:MAG: sensor histidine kinase [Clostridia bacterium]|nr:sensor histidine kinase [Clostridia bacterium]
MYLSELTKSTARVTPILLITLAFVLCNVLLYVLVDQMRHLQHRKYELRRLEEKIAAEKEQYEEAAVLWDNARILRHDMKQHFAVMLGQLEAGETEECKRYIQAVTSGIEASGRTVKTGTPILDYILSSRLAKAENVDVVLMGAVDTFDDIESSDLASLFGNILDNALEALAKIDGTHEKHLELLLSMHNSQRIIICKNTTTESVLKSNKHLTSSKPDWESHGFGHRIILQIARKYHGTVDYFEEDGMFGVQVQIPLRRTPQANGEGL